MCGVVYYTREQDTSTVLSILKQAGLKKGHKFDFICYTNSLPRDIYYIHDGIFRPESCSEDWFFNRFLYYTKICLDADNIVGSI